MANPHFINRRGRREFRHKKAQKILATEDTENTEKYQNSKIISPFNFPPASAKP
jgi:hypothetical protein